MWPAGIGVGRRLTRTLPPASTGRGMSPSLLTIDPSLMTSMCRPHILWSGERTVTR